MSSVPRLASAAVAAAFALGLAACGGPSSAQSASQELSAGIAAQKSADYGTATTDYEKVLTSEPKNKYALYDLGDVQQFEGEYASAAKNYLKALAVDPNFVLALYNLGILSTATHPGVARSLFEQAIKLDPSDALAHYHLGKVLLALHLTKQGNHELQIANHLDPNLAK